MNCIPLPDDLIRVVYSYILPISDYIEFIKISALHKKEESEAYNGSNQVLVQLEQLNFNQTGVDISTRLRDSITYYNFVIDYGIKMSERLHKIERFINDNPLFKKFAKGRVLEGLAPSINEQEKHVSIMENTISKRRAKVHMIGDITTFKRVVLYDDLAKILSVKGGCLETIIHHCKMNQIPVISGPYSEMQRKAGGWSDRKEYRDYLVKKLISL